MQRLRYAFTRPRAIPSSEASPRCDCSRAEQTQHDPGLLGISWSRTSSWHSVPPNRCRGFQFSAWTSIKFFYGMNALKARGVTRQNREKGYCSARFRLAVASSANAKISGCMAVVPGASGRASQRRDWRCNDSKEVFGLWSRYLAPDAQTQGHCHDRQSFGARCRAIRAGCDTSVCSSMFGQVWTHRGALQPGKGPSAQAGRANNSSPAPSSRQFQPFGNAMLIIWFERAPV